MLLMAIISTISFTACTTASEDGDENSDSCTTCTLILLESEYCDNGDGTVTITAGGETTTQSLEGQSLDSFITALELVTPGLSCD